MTRYELLAIEDGGPVTARTPTSSRRRNLLLSLASLGIVSTLVVLLWAAALARTPAHVACVALSAPSLEPAPGRRSSWNGLSFALSPTCAGEVRPAYHRLPTCSFDIERSKRFESLRGSAARHPILLAALLADSEAVVSVWLRELPLLVSILGGVHVAIYESGSKDRTVELLARLVDALERAGATLCVARTILGADWLSTIVAGGHEPTENRIPRLARLRNAVLAPLHDPLVAIDRPFDSVIFANDVSLCASDLLELLLQRRQLGADLVCAPDYTLDWGPQPHIRDIWVARDLGGALIYDEERLFEKTTRPVHFANRPIDAERWRNVRPIQLATCWNGAVVFAADALRAPANVSFRAINGTDEQSECYLFSLDLWRSGFGKIAMAPRARLAYSSEVYDRVHDPAFERAMDRPWQADEAIDWLGPPGQIRDLPYFNFDALSWEAWPA